MSLRLILLLVAVIFQVPFASAQSRAFECNEHSTMPKAQAAKIAAAVQGTYSKVKGLTANFSQDSYLAALEVSEVSAGTMSFLKPGRMRWDYITPEPQVFLVKDHAIYFYQPRDNQVVVDEFTNVLITDLPVAFIMGIGDLTKDFVIDEACTGRDGTILTLSGKERKGAKKGEKNPLKAFKLLINTVNNLPIGAKVTDVGGNITSILLSKISTDPTFGDDAFELKSAPGTDVIDKRQE